MRCFRLVMGCVSWIIVSASLAAAAEVDSDDHRFAMDMDSYHASWQVTFDAEDVPAIDLVSQVCEHLGLEFDATEDQRRRLEKPITVERRNISRLQALELIAAEVGLYPKYPYDYLEYTTDDREAYFIKFAPLPRPNPVSFAGPFLVELREVEEHPPHATGRLSLWVFAGKLPPIVEWSVREETQWLTPIRHACSPSGRQLAADLHPSTSGWTYPDDAPLFQEHPHVELVDLLRDVDRIAHVNGVIRFSFPTKAETLVWKSADEIRKGASRESEHLKVTITSAKSDGKSLSLEMEPRGDVELDQFDPIRFMAEDSAGKDTGFARFRFGDKVNLTSSEPPAKLKVVVGLDAATVSYPFSFADIPLPSHEQQPAEIAPLQFDRDAPVTWQFIKFTSGPFDNQDMEIELTNNSSRRVRRMELALRYFDADGKLLEEKNPTLGYTIDPGETVRKDLSFVPDKARSAEGEIVEVQFADLAEWKRDADDADASITGRGQLWLDEATGVKLGYVGFTDDGQWVHDGCGFNDVDSWSNSITTGTFKPRRTHFGLTRPKNCRWTHACTFRLTNLPAGTYLVYLQMADGPIDWQWVKYDQHADVSPLDFQLDMRQFGRIEVQVPDGVSADDLRLVPLDSDGHIPLADEHMDQLFKSLSHRLPKPKLQDGRAIWERVDGGRYRVVAGDWSKTVEVRADEAAHDKATHSDAQAGWRSAVQRGEAAIDRADWKRAIEAYSKAIRLKPQDGLSYFFRGWAYREIEAFDEAIADQTQAIAHSDPPGIRASARHERGLSYLKQGESKKAMEDFTKAIELAPNNAQYYVSRATAHQKLGNTSQAQADLDRSEALRPAK